MKKVLLVFVFVAVIATGSVFADHPKGWGLGIMGRYSSGGDYYHNQWGPALSLKVPSIPIYWGISLDIDTGRGYSWFDLGVSGDYYFIDKKLIPAINLNWFLGGGLYGNFYSFSSDGYDSWGLGLGARLPVGISWQPIPLLEIFLDLAPSLGFYFDSNHFHFPTWGWPFEIGLRFWF